MSKSEELTADTLDTRLLDLSALSLEALGALTPVQLAEPLDSLFEQVDWPRVNLGSGPPGRVD